MDVSKTRAKVVEELKIKIIEENSSELLDSLEAEKTFNRKNIRHRKLERLEISRKIINTIKELIFDTATLKLNDIYDLELELE